MINSHKDLIVWQKSFLLAKDIYKITRKLPQTEIYGITSQLRRASVSIPTNIAEGAGKGSNADFRRFLHIAFGSASEVEYLLFLSTELKFISESEFEPIAIQMNLLRQKLIQLRKKLL